jgi:hypothetical protein
MRCSTWGYREVEGHEKPAVGTYQQYNAPTIAGALFNS